MAFIGGGFGVGGGFRVGDVFGRVSIQGAGGGGFAPDFPFFLSSNANLFNGWGTFGGSSTPLIYPGPFERVGPSLSGDFHDPSGTGGFFVRTPGNNVAWPGPTFVPGFGGGPFGQGFGGGFGGGGFGGGGFGGGGFGGGGFGGGGFGGIPGFPPFLGQPHPAFGGLPGLAPHLGQPDPAFGGLPGLAPHLGQPDPAFGGVPGLPPHLGQPDPAFGGGPGLPPGFGFGPAFGGFGGFGGPEAIHPFATFGFDVGLRAF